MTNKFESKHNQAVIDKCTVNSAGESIVSISGSENEPVSLLRKICLGLSNAILQFPAMFELQQAALNQPTLLRKEVKEEIDQLRQSQTNFRVIDYGCGSGTYTGLFNPGNYLGIDCCASMIKHAAQKHPSHTFVQASDLTGISDNLEGVSAIFLIGVIHHLPEDLLVSILNRLPKTQDVRLLSIDTLRCDKGLGAFIQLFERGEYLRYEHDHKRILDRIAVQTDYKKVMYGSYFELAVFRGLVRKEIG